MKLGLLTGLTAALALTGTAGARAETIYVTEPAFVETAPAYAVPVPIVEGAPAYVYTAPAPIAADSGYYVTTGPAYAVVPPQPGYVMVAPPAGYVVDRSVELVAPRSDDYRYYDNRDRTPARRAVPVRAVEPISCAIDASGFERCY
jgi:hypothetical protein